MFAFKHMQLGLTNAFATFQNLDIMPSKCSWGKLKKYLYMYIPLGMSTLNIIASLNPSKCQIWVKYGVILGNIVSRNDTRVDKSKVNLILVLLSPTSYKGSLVLHGTCNNILSSTHFVLHK